LDSITHLLGYVMLILPSLLKGALVTLEVFALTIIFALPLGLPFGLGSNSRFFFFKWPSKAYIWLFRGTPLILQLFFFYYFFFPAIGLPLDSITIAIITFVLNYAAYFAEIYRAGIESIDKGQYEAAKSLGLSRSQTMFGIIIPQTVKRVLPPISNEVITLVKDTALVSVIGVAELLKNARSAVNRDVNTVAAYAVAAAIYLLFTFLLTLLSRYLEKRFSRHEAKEV